MKIKPLPVGVALTVGPVVGALAMAASAPLAVSIGLAGVCALAGFWVSPESLPGKKPVFSVEPNKPLEPQSLPERLHGALVAQALINQAQATLNSLASFKDAGELTPWLLRLSRAQRLLNDTVKVFSQDSRFDPKSFESQIQLLCERELQDLVEQLYALEQSDVRLQAEFLKAAYPTKEIDK